MKYITLFGISNFIESKNADIEISDLSITNALENKVTYSSTR